MLLPARLFLPEHVSAAFWQMVVFMVFNDNDVVLINLTSSVKDGEVFDSTIESVAKEHGFFEKERIYKPFPIVLGAKEVFPALEQRIKEMSAGEKKSFALSPEESFGERSQELIGIIPAREFQSRKINPVKGLVIEMNGRQGRVQSVSGGRVRVDFNSPLAGKEIEYEVEVREKIDGDRKKAEMLFDKYFSGVPENERKLSIGADSVEVSLSPRFGKAFEPFKVLFSKLVEKSCHSYKSVKFVEEFKAETPDAAKAEKGESEKPDAGAEKPAKAKPSDAKPSPKPKPKKPALESNADI